MSGRNKWKDIPRKRAGWHWLLPMEVYPEAMLFFNSYQDEWWAK